MNATNKEDPHQMHALVDELSRLRDQIQRQPSPWAYSRIAAIEGILAAHREAAAWVEAQEIIAKLRRG